MSIPYRTQQTLKRLAVIALVVLLAAALVWLCWIGWLSRYIVYTRDGAVLDFTRSSAELSGELAVPPEDDSLIEIYYNEGDDAIETSTDLSQIAGYYIDLSALKGDLEEIKDQIKALPQGTPVMMDVKDSFGSFYYSTQAGEFTTDTVDLTAVDGLIKYLNESGMYTIARLPALRDYSYGLNHSNDGLPTSGGYLWADEDYRYWLNPARENIISYLIGIANELKALGFDEVVFDEFHFPQTDQIIFSGDKAQTLANAAQTLVNTCATGTFAVSFEYTEGFTAPTGRSRVYVKDVNALKAASIAESAGVADTAVNLVFVTELYDTRFDVYSVLRPLNQAH